MKNRREMLAAQRSGFVAYSAIALIVALRRCESANPSTGQLRSLLPKRNENLGWRGGFVAAHEKEDSLENFIAVVVCLVLLRLLREVGCRFQKCAVANHLAHRLEE